MFNSFLKALAVFVFMNFEKQVFQLQVQLMGLELGISLQESVYLVRKHVERVL